MIAPAGAASSPSSANYDDDDDDDGGIRTLFDVAKVVMVVKEKKLERIYGRWYTSTVT